MNNPWVLWLITLLTAGGGAWFGSYLREKAKNYATKEDIKKLTTLTEEVKADISGKMWLVQKRWDLKRDFYWELLAVINELSSVLRNMRGMLQLDNLAPEKLLEFASEFKVVAGRAQEQENALARILGIGRILLSENVVTLLDSYQMDLKQVERTAKSTLSQYQRPKAEIDAMSNPDREQYWERFIKEYPGAMTQIVDTFIKRHHNVMPEIVRAARNDLLSLSEGQ